MYSYWEEQLKEAKIRLEIARTKATVKKWWRRVQECERELRKDL
jgi:hypothetical protein